MHMALKVHRWTRADLLSLPDDGNRYEVLDGRLFVTPLPSPAHQQIAVALMLRLEPYVARHGLGFVVGPGAVVFGEDEVEPDVVVFPGSRPALKAKWDQLPCPSLVVEVLSMTTRRRDLNDKRKAYQRLRIEDYWIVDPFDRRALCWSPTDGDPRVVTDTLDWRPSALTEAFTIALEHILPPTEAD